MVYLHLFLHCKTNIGWLIAPRIVMRHLCDECAGLGTHAGARLRRLANVH